MKGWRGVGIEEGRRIEGGGSREMGDEGGGGVLQFARESRALIEVHGWFLSWSHFLHTITVYEVQG